MDKEFILLTFIFLGVIIMILSCLHIKENLNKRRKQLNGTVINLRTGKNIIYEDNIFTSKRLYNLAIDRVTVDNIYDLKEAVKEYRRIDEDLLLIGKQLQKPFSVNDSTKCSK